jgi:hypothetical protein
MTRLNNYTNRPTWQVALRTLATFVALGLALYAVVQIRDDAKRQSDFNRRLIEQNKDRLDQLARIQRLETPPTDAEVAAAARRALLICSRTPACRRQFLVTLKVKGGGHGGGSNPRGSP